MVLPSRSDLESPRSAEDMCAIIRGCLVATGPNAVSNQVFFLRSNPIIKVLIEEYTPLACYLSFIDRTGRRTACLSRLGASHDAEIWENEQCTERIQIVQGTETYSEALKREALKNGKIVMTDSEYIRNKQSRAPKEVSPNTSSIRDLAEGAAESIIERIKKKISKGYSAIDTLLVRYTETMSTPITKSHVVITQKVDDWLKTKTPADMSPFTRLVLVSDRGRVRIWDL